MSTNRHHFTDCSADMVVRSPIVQYRGSTAMSDPNGHDASGATYNTDVRICDLEFMLTLVPYRRTIKKAPINARLQSPGD